MAKGAYNGGRTVISPGKNPDWFGNSGPVIPREERAEQIRKELRRKRKAESVGRWDDVERQLKEALQEQVDARAVKNLVEMPTVAEEKPVLDAKAEARIVGLKKDLAGLAADVRKAAAMHEQCRQELIHLLARYDLSEDAYPETRKLSL